MIDKNSRIPIYYQIAEEFRNKIETGQLEYGDLLPSERELAEAYRISRMTVRQAINELKLEGIIVREKGKGTFVARRKFEQDLSRLTSFSEDIKQRDWEPSNKLIEIKIITDDSLVASILNVGVKDKVYKIKRIRMANEEPIALETVFTPQKRVGELNEQDLTGSFYNTLENKLQLHIAYGEETIEAAIANKEEMKYLGIQQGDPVLLMQRTSFLQNEAALPVEYVKSAYRSDIYKFKMRLKR